MKGKRRRLWERGKTLLILLLTCSAVYLAARTLFPQQPGGLIPHLAPAADSPAATSSVALSNQTLRPAAFAVTWSEGRYGLLYHQDDQEGYTHISALLAEALHDAAQPVQVTQRAWRQALDAPGVFYEYLGPLPLDSLSLWLSGQANAALSGFEARRLCVNAQNLYFQDSAERFYACALSPDLSADLAQLFDHFSPNGARFAGEEERFQLLRADALVLPLTPSLPQLLAEDPIPLTDPAAPAEDLTQLLHALSFHPQTNPLYAITGGWAITDDAETLRISADGQLTYRRSGEGTPHFPCEEDALNVTRALAEKTVGALCGSGRLYLQSVRQEGTAQVITYAYAYRGAAIHLGEEGWCAQFTVEDGAVSAFTLKPRRYAAQEDRPVLLLPQEQAAAALTGSKKQALEILYDDQGVSQSLAPFWAVRDTGR